MAILLLFDQLSFSSNWYHIFWVTPLPAKNPEGCLNSSCDWIFSPVKSLGSKKLHRSNITVHSPVPLFYIVISKTDVQIIYIKSFVPVAVILSFLYTCLHISQCNPQRRKFFLRARLHWTKRFRAVKWRLNRQHEIQRKLEVAVSNKMFSCDIVLQSIKWMSCKSCKVCQEVLWIRALQIANKRKKASCQVRGLKSM